MKKLVLLFCFLFIGLNVSAETIVKVGVIDLNRIYQIFNKDSQAVKDLEEFRNKITSESDAMKADIQKLEEQKIVEQKAGNAQKVLLLDDEINKKTDYLKDYVRIKGSEYNTMRKKLSDSSTFLNQIQQEIRYVAESNGFTLILTSIDPYIIYWSKEIDVTDLVLQRIQAKKDTK